MAGVDSSLASNPQLRSTGRPFAAFVLAAVLGYAYVLLLPWHPYHASYLLKAAPVLILLALSAYALRGRERLLMVLAFAAAACGDMFLDFDRTRYLRPALACFLVTQIAYASVFAGKARWQPSRLAVVVLLAALALGFVGLAWGSLDAMRVPVLVYALALLAMASSAVMIPGSRCLSAGGVLFLCADLLIGVNRFVMPFDYSTALIVTLYMTAQLSIAWGMLFVPARYSGR